MNDNLRSSYNYTDDEFNRQIYLKLEAFPIVIQEIIFAKLSLLDRLLIQRVSKTWRSIVRKNGWNSRAMELDCRCVRNIDRFQTIGFGSRVRKLVLNIDEFCEQNHLENWDAENWDISPAEEDDDELCGASSEAGARGGIRRKYLSHVEEIANFFCLPVFCNLVHLRIEPTCTETMIRTKIFEQIAELKSLKTLSLGCLADNHDSYDFKFPPLELLVLDHESHWVLGYFEDASPLCSLIQQPLKSFWLDGDVRAFLFRELFLGVRFLGLGRLHLTSKIVSSLCELKNNNLIHLSFKLHICYFIRPDREKDCYHPAEAPALDFTKLKDIFLHISATLASLEVENIGPKELGLVLNHCKLLEHLAFTFFEKKRVPHMNVVTMMNALKNLPNALVHLRSLEFLLDNLLLVDKEPMRVLADEILGPTLRELATKGRIEYLSVELYDWDEEQKERKQIQLADHVAFKFVLHCTNLRYLGHKLQCPNSRIEIIQLLDEKMKIRERSLADSLLIMPKQDHHFSHFLVAFCEYKPRNHVFCDIREDGLASVPPDFFFTKPLLHRKIWADDHRDREYETDNDDEGNSNEE